MWKKDESNPIGEDLTPARPYTLAENSRGERAVIGASITIKGELSGDEDLIIEGRVEGKIELKQHKITVGKKGVVRADMHAKTISVEGEVQGTLSADEQVVLCRSSTVRGDIIAPRVTLEDGAKFKGSIDMELKSQEKGRPSAVSTEQSKGVFEPARVEPSVKATPRVG